MKAEPFNIRLNAQQTFLNDRLDVSFSINNITKFSRKTIQEVNAETFYIYNKTEQNYLPLSLTIKFRFGSFKVKPVKSVKRGVVITDIKGESDE